MTNATDDGYKKYILELDNDERIKHLKYMIRTTNKPDIDRYIFLFFSKLLSIAMFYDISNNDIWDWYRKHISVDEQFKQIVSEFV